MRTCEDSAPPVFERLRLARLSIRGHSAEEVDAMFAAWFKSVALQVALWTQAYSPELL